MPSRRITRGRGQRAGRIGLIVTSTALLLVTAASLICFKLIPDSPVPPFVPVALVTLAALSMLMLGVWQLRHDVDNGGVHPGRRDHRRSLSNADLFDFVVGTTLVIILVSLLVCSYGHIEANGPTPSPFNTTF